jgi:DNA-binding MarR family transcriptional regulator
MSESADAVLVASRALVGIAARSLAPTEQVVTPVQYRALVLFAAYGPMNVGNLAEELGVHQSTATRLCDRLVAKDLVARAESPRSRREVVVSLTGAGFALIEAATARRRAELDTVLRRLTPEQRATVTEAFRLFATAAREAPDDAWKLGWTA